MKTGKHYKKEGKLKKQSMDLIKTKTRKLKSKK